MRRRTLIRVLLLVLLAGTLCSACNSNVHMYRHNRSHCDCPTF